MPFQSWGGNDRPLLTGLFGIFQSAASGYLSTSDIWSTLRSSAATWRWQAGGTDEYPSDDELQETGAGILRAQGIGIQQVNTYQALAGNWRAAKDNLMGADPSQEVEAGMIFQPPWARTLGGEVPSRYRMKVQWDIELPDGSSAQTWGTYEMDSPLTTIQDALDQARAMVGAKPTSDMPPGAVVQGTNNYEMEQI